MTDRPADRRTKLAGYWNAWLYPREIEAAHALAEMGTEEECRAELERLETIRKSRLEQWRRSR